MTETDDALEQAKRKLQGEGTVAIPTRERDPSYHVFRQTQLGQFTLLTDETNPVKASSRKDAIQQVVPSKSADDHGAETFLVIPEQQFKLLTRKVQTEVVETFE
jgi:hypothetical protein